MTVYTILTIMDIYIPMLEENRGKREVRIRHSDNCKQ